MIPLPAGVRGLVFDCDGTLVDSMPIHKRLWDEGLAPYGIELPPDYIDTHAGKPTEVIVELVNRDWGVSIDPVAFHHEKERRYLAEVHTVGPIAPVVATAREWLGRLPMAVVSGGVRQNVEQSLRAIGAWEWFPVVLTADDPIAPKPAPDLFLAAAERLALAPTECHAFEDADAGIAAARAAGMTVTDVRTIA
jgi:HAD superfamily hydrolase (TIGR01509 family)